MTDLEKILQLVQKNDGYITTKEVVENNLNKRALKRLCDSGGGIFTFFTSSNSSPSLVGITSGGLFTTDESENITGELSSVTYFSNLNNILSSLGVTGY